MTIAKRRVIGIFNNFLDAETALQKMYGACAVERVYVMVGDTDRENRLIQTLVCESLRDRFNCRISTAIRHSTDAVEDDVVSLTDALTHLDVPQETARRYNYLVAQNKYLIAIEGRATEIDKAIAVLDSCDLQDRTVYEIDRNCPEIVKLTF